MTFLSKEDFNFIKTFPIIYRGGGRDKNERNYKINFDNSSKKNFYETIVNILRNISPEKILRGWIEAEDPSDEYKLINLNNELDSSQKVI